MPFERCDDVTICVRAGFEAAHHLPAMPDGHKCKRMHGHNYAVEVMVRGTICVDNGCVLDYYDIEQHLRREVIDQWDHRVLNECGFEHPTTENLAVEIWKRLAPLIPIEEVKVYETPHYWCSFKGWK